MVKAFFESLWPTLRELLPHEEQEDRDKLEQMRLAINEADWEKEGDVALDEARRLFDAEVERRKGAEVKAGIYLAAITALIPVLVSLLPTLWSDKAHKLLGFILLFIFVWAVAYLLRAGAWAFHTLHVKGFAQIGAGELATAWKNPKPQAQLIKELSRALLYNYPLTNKKVSGIMMTHEFLLRAFLSFSVLMVVQVIWPVGAWMLGEIKVLLKPDLVAPLMMCYS